MKNTNTDLRNHLFALLEDLQDPDKEVDLERAKITVEVSQTIINSAKLEVDAMKIKAGLLKHGSEQKQFDVPFLEPKKDYFN